MATVVVDFGRSSEKTVFHGSSEEDAAFAKTFWQSIHLLPPLESRLVSSDIKQRLKKAQTGEQGKTYSYVPSIHNEAYEKFMTKAHEMERMDKMRKVESLNRKKAEDQARLCRARENRLEKEKISKDKGVKPSPLKIPEPSFEEDDKDIAKHTIEELDKFERHHRLEKYIKELPDEEDCAEIKHVTF